MHGVQKCVLFTSDFDHVAVVREINTFHVFIIFFPFVFTPEFVIEIGVCKNVLIGNRVLL